MVAFVPAACLFTKPQQRLYVVEQPLVTGIAFHNSRLALRAFAVDYRLPLLITANQLIDGAAPDGFNYFS